MTSSRHTVYAVLSLSIAVAVILAAFGLAGCRSTQVVGPEPPARTYAAITEEARERTVEVELRDGTVYGGYNLLVTQDSTRFDRKSGDRDPVVVPTAQVREITIRKHGRGAVDGLGIGAAVGLGLGFLMGVTLHDGPGFFDDTRAESGLLAGGALGLLGGTLGTFFGLVGGHRTVYRFDDTGTPQRVESGDEV
jgi:hypothetical protein